MSLDEAPGPSAPVPGADAGAAVRAAAAPAGPARTGTGPDGPPPVAAAYRRLLAALHAAPWEHDFFALMRRVDALHPHLPRTGTARLPRHEPLRLGQAPELDFAPAPLQRLQARDGLPPRLLVRFLGLLGPQGPMPLALTEHVRERLHQHGDAASAHFLDLFHHRMLSFFHRAWAQAQPVVQADRPDDDRFLAWLAALAGLPPTPPALPRTAPAFQAGLLADRTLPPEAVCRVLRQQFGVPAAVVAHAPQWLELGPEDRSRLGFARNRVERGAAPGAALGRDSHAGSRVPDRQSRFRLRLGPLPRERFASLLPGGVRWAALAGWMRLLARPELRWELELELAAPDRPAPTLGSAARPAPQPRPGVRLGVTSWLAPRRGLPEPAATLRLRPDTGFLQRRPLPTL